MKANYRPRAIVLEFNRNFDHYAAVTVNIKVSHETTNSRYTGLDPDLRLSPDCPSLIFAAGTMLFRMGKDGWASDTLVPLCWRWRSFCPCTTTPPFTSTGMPSIASSSGLISSATPTFRSSPGLDRSPKEPMLAQPPILGENDSIGMSSGGGALSATGSKCYLVDTVLAFSEGVPAQVPAPVSSV